MAAAGMIPAFDERTPYGRRRRSLERDAESLGCAEVGLHAQARLMMSEVPPGPKGTTMVTGLSG